MLQSKCGGGRPRTTLGSQFSVGSGITLRSQYEFYVLSTMPLNKMNSKVYSKFSFIIALCMLALKAVFIILIIPRGMGECAHTYVQCESLWRPRHQILLQLESQAIVSSPV